MSTQTQHVHHLSTQTQQIYATTIPQLRTESCVTTSDFKISTWRWCPMDQNKSVVTMIVHLYLRRLNPRSIFTLYDRDNFETGIPVRFLSLTVTIDVFFVSWLVFNKIISVHRTNLNIIKHIAESNNNIDSKLIRR